MQVQKVEPTRLRFRFHVSSALIQRSLDNKKWHPQVPFFIDALLVKYFILDAVADHSMR